MLKVPAEDIVEHLEYPPNPDLGDLALPCFRFAKTLRRNPADIAKDVASALAEHPAFARAEATGGYVNVQLNRDALMRDVVRTLQSHPEQWFSRQRGQGRTAAIDYSSPNIAKPFGVGHLRSTVIGQAIVHLLEADGWRVVGINHLGDWGTQFGKIIVAYRKWGDEAVVRANPVRELFSLYVRFHDEAEKHPELDDEAREWFKKLEEGDAEATRLWQWFIDESLKVFRAMYHRLGVQFDHYLGESFYNDMMQVVVDELRSKGLLVESDGAEVVDLSAWNMPPCIIVKSDGATIYATRDLAAANYRHDQFGADTLLYVVGAEQTLHFQQVFKVLELMGRSWAANCQHVAFGMMKYNGERMSTRRGKIVYLEDVLDKAVAEAKRIIEEKNPSLEDKDSVAEAVGIGAVIFNDLKSYRMHDVDFRYEEVLNFDGETGPYVQYTHARACSVLRKAEATPGQAGSVDNLVDVHDAEWRLITVLAQAQEVLERAVDELDPSLIARFLLDVCHAFNRFYHDCPILSAEAARDQRLALTDAVRSALAYGLHLLGLKAPTAM
ncbi:arginine--tRNA ligase 1 [Alicyclobacillus contaminans]|nr:arginine--tRNA ligase 1 [Alicyclobacillus contaminans]